MTTFTFLHEINDFIYAIRDCNDGTKDAVQRGEVIAFRASGIEPSSNTTTPVFDMEYDIRFDGDTFATTIKAPFTLLTAQFLTTGQTQANYGGVSPQGSFVAGSGFLAGDSVTLSDGSVVTINTVITSGSPEVVGQVATFAVVNVSTQAVVTGTPLTQLATSGAGIGFSLTPGAANVTLEGFAVQETTTGSSIFDNKNDAIAAYSALLP